MLDILCNLVPNYSPRQVIVDFEKAIISAVHITFPLAEVKGCYFHLTQNLVKKINQVGLKSQFQSDLTLKLMLKSFAALSFVPESDVKTVFVELANSFPDDSEYSDLITYFQYTYIEGAVGRNPQFPIPLWNHYYAAIEGGPRTTNCCEGYHNALNALFQCSHPSIWNLFDGLIGILVARD